MLLNIGPTRVDGMQEIQKLNIASGIVLREVAKEIMFASLSLSQSGNQI
jgi:NAD-dependent deacetylase sirtuin 4